MTKEETKLEFINTADIIWDQVEIDGTGIKSFQELYKILQKTIEDKRALGKGVLLSISLSNISLNDKEWINVKNGELLQALQDQEKDEDSFVWPIYIEANQSIEWERSKLETESQFYKEMFQTADSIKTINESMEPLYDHPVASKFLERLFR